MAVSFFTLTLCWMVLVAIVPTGWAQGPGLTAGQQHLLIYAIDVEGGQSTLLVSPSGASLLVDTGWPGNDGRDAERIQAAMKDAGITRIDHVLITHFHTDHVGGVPELVKHVQVGEFLDHGVNR
ncbi:MAG: MBL fold metallo-hydrolase, partial [Terracidiphilus sp.]